MTARCRITKSATLAYEFDSQSNPRLKTPTKPAQARPMMFQAAGGRFSSCGTRICEASAGDNVSEQKHEIAVATAIVMANCWKNCPEMPPRNAVGTNTAHKTSAIDTSALPTSS